MGSMSPHSIFLAIGFVVSGVLSPDWVAASKTSTHRCSKLFRSAEFYPEDVFRRNGLNPDSLSFFLSISRFDGQVKVFYEEQLMAYATLDRLQVNSNRSVPVFSMIEVFDSKTGFKGGDFRGKGVDTFLYLAVAEHIYRRYKLTLHQSNDVSLFADEVWKRLFERGYAEKLIDQEMQYRMRADSFSREEFLQIRSFFESRLLRQDPFPDFVPVTQSQF